MKLASFGNRPQVVGVVLIVIATFAVIWFASNQRTTAGVANKLRNFMGLASSTSTV